MPAVHFSISLATHYFRPTLTVKRLRTHIIILHRPSNVFSVSQNFDQPDGQSLTPLTMAAMSGNVKFVKTLLSHYDVDLERECNVIFDGMVVYGATALWVAAGMGHLQIVKMLVQAGAAINHNTKAQSSPLRAACYEGESKRCIFNYYLYKFLAQGVVLI